MQQRTHTPKRAPRPAPAARQRRLCLEGLEDRIALTAIWINPNGGDWFDPRNWQISSGASLPEATDDVIIDNLDAGAVVRYSAPRLGVSGVHSISSTAPFLMLAGPLAIAETSSFTELFVAGGELTGPGDLEVSDQLGWGGGTLSGSGAIVSRGLLHISDPPTAVNTSPRVLDGRQLVNFGTADFTSTGSVQQLNGAEFINQPGAGFTHATDADFGPLFHNAGLFVKAGAGISRMSVFVNSGQVFLRAGSLHVFAYSQAGGQTMLVGGSLRADNGVDINAGSVTGTGFIDANVSNDGTITPTPSPSGEALVINGDYAQGTRGRLVLGTFGSDVSRLVVNGRAFLDGTTSLDGGALDSVNPIQIDGALTGAGSIGANVSNDGTVRVGEMLLIDGDFTQGAQGRLFIGTTGSEVSSQLVVNGNAMLGGTTALIGGARFDSPNPIRVDGTLGGLGTINADVRNDGRVMPAPAGVLEINGAYLQGPDGDLTVRLSGTPNQLRVRNAAALDGALHITYAPGFVPAAGQRFRIMQYSAHAGEFASLFGTNPSAEIQVLADYNADNLTLISQANAPPPPPPEDPGEGGNVIDGLLPPEQPPGSPDEPGDDPGSGFDPGVADPREASPPLAANDPLAAPVIPESVQVPIGVPAPSEARGQSGVAQSSSAGVAAAPAYVLRLPKASGSDKVGGELVETALDKLQTVFEDIDVPMADDELTGADIAGALLTGARPRANLLPQKGARVAPVATLLTGDAPDNPAADAAKSSDDRLRDSLINPLQNGQPARPAPGQRSQGPENDANPLALPIAGALLVVGVLNGEKKRGER